MTKATLAMTVCSVLVLAGCVQNREPGTVRSGPQVESPTADAPGGKLPSDDGAVTNVIIDDSATRLVVTTSIFELTR